MITESQAANRMNYLGASDIPIVLGLSRFSTPYDLWLRKTGQLTESSEYSEAIEAGKYFEEGVIQKAISLYGAVIRNQERRWENTPIKVHLDAILKNEPVPVEIKVEGLFHYLRDGWGEEGTDQVPDDVLVQVMTQIAACGAERAIVGAFLGGIGFRFYEIRSDENLISIIREEAERFWEKVEKRTPPEGFPTMESIRRIQRVDRTIEFSDKGLLREYFETQAVRKQYEEKEEELKRTILTMLGDSTQAKCILEENESLAEVSISVKKQAGRKAVDMEKLEKNYPQVYSDVVKPTEITVARITKKTLKRKGL